MRGMMLTQAARRFSTRSIANGCASNDAPTVVRTMTGVNAGSLSGEQSHADRLQIRSPSVVRDLRDEGAMKAAVTIFSALLCITSGLYAQDVNHDGVVDYLVPISAPSQVSGANGSLWKTELWLHNGLDAPFALSSPCEVMIPEGPCPPVPLHQSGVTEQAFHWETRYTARSLIFQLPLALADRITLSSRLFELSRHAQPAGVDLPLVREDQFFIGSSRFIAIPRDGSSRVALRVYDPRRTLFNDIHVELITPDGTVIGETTLYPSITSAHEPATAAIYDLAAAFPSLASVERFDVRVTPVPGMEYWALVSVTDWDTQQVLLITAN
jgi:hypothetical protein